MTDRHEPTAIKRSDTATERSPRQPTVFINARLVDPASSRDEPGGLLVRGRRDRRSRRRTCGATRRTGPRSSTARAIVLCPGLIDAQVFTGEPGFEHRETLKTASHAAAAGGVTTIVVMPDTNPVIDQVALVDFIQRRARDNAVVNVHTMAAMTKGLKGEEMTEIGLLQRAGAIAFTNGKSSVANTRVMRNVLLYAKDFGALIVHHTEDPYLVRGRRDELGRGGDAARPAGRAEGRRDDRARARRAPRRDDRRALSRRRRSPAPRASTVIRSAKARELPVTCGVSINHLTLNENDIGPYRTFFKVRPPLRSEDDRVGDGARRCRGRHRHHRLEPRPAGRRRQAPPVRGSGRRRHRARDAAAGRAAPVPRRRGRLLALLRAHDDQPGEAARPARRPARARAPPPTSSWSISASPGS